ncbi:MAG: flagellin [Alphaproteobacteria bacterium]|nr:flagellin [Alphaproteobacteria bacterium]
MPSVNTNIGALLAQKYLRATSDQLNSVQNHVSSGLRVAGSADDASTFAVAQGLRADIKSYVAVSSALSGAKAVATVAVTAAESISNRLQDVKAKVLQLADDSISAASRASYQTDLQAMIAEVNSYLQSASYNGTNVLASTNNVKTVANIDASTITITAQNVQNMTMTTITGSASSTTALAELNTFKAAIDTALANLGANVKAIDAQNEFIKQVNETVTVGLGALVDADMAKETAALQALQVKQQLGVQALGIANQAPQALLSLLRG